jgi:hypothetical protein
MSDQSNDDVDVAKTNSRLSADKRTDNVLNMLFEYNDEVDNDYEKIYISKSGFLDFIKKCKNEGKVDFTTSKDVITRCLERRRNLVSEHHEKHNLKSDHNLKSYYARLKLSNLN